MTIVNYGGLGASEEIVATMAEHGFVEGNEHTAQRQTPQTIKAEGLRGLSVSIF